MDSSFRTNEKIKSSTKWFFALGDIFQGGFFNIVNFFYSIFLTDIIGINPIWAANVFLLGKVWDAITDPAMGTISDNTRSRLGRRRPYFLIGAPLVLISFVMMWFPLSSGTPTAKLIFFIFAYILANTASTIVSVPFLAMTAELSTDYDERTSITNIRMIVSIASTLVCALVPMMIVGMYQDVRTGYIVMSVVFGLFFSLPLLVTFFTVKERKQFAETKHATLKETFGTLRLKVFRQFILMYLCIVVAIDTTSMIFAYFMTYNLGRAGELNFVLGALIIAEVALVPVATIVCGKWGKNRSVVFGNIGWILTALCSMLVQKSSPFIVVYIVAAVMGAFIAFSLVGFTSLFADVTEVGEYHFGKRMEGSFSGIQQFIRKCAAAVANWAALTLLGIAGFINPVREMVDGVTQITPQPQTAAVIFTIKAILGFSAVLLLVPSTIIAIRWKLTKDKHRKLVEYLDKKRAGLPVEPALETEVQALCATLI